MAEVRVALTTLDGEVLELFIVTSEGTDIKTPERLASEVRDKVEMKFNTKEME